MTTGVAIVGVSDLDPKTIAGRSVHSLQTEVITLALADAGLTLADVDGLATVGVGGFPATEMCEYLGIRPTWTDSSSAGGSSFEIFVHHAVAAIQAGLCTTVVVSYGSNQKSARSRRVGGGGAAGGPVPVGSERGVRTAVRIHDADVAVRARPVGTCTSSGPRRSSWRGRGVGAGVGLAEPEGVPLRSSVNSPSTTCSRPDMQSDPLHKLDCCLVTDGGGAVVLTPTSAPATST